MLSSEQIAELHEAYESVNPDGSGSISKDHVGPALKLLGIDLPGYQVRDLLDKYVSREISVSDFTKIYTDLAERKAEETQGWKKNIARVNDAYHVHGDSSEIVHTIRIAEEVAFANWINSMLGNDPDLQRLLPVAPDNGDLYKKVEDGVIMCKLVNHSAPDTIDERAINKKNLNTYTKLENLTLALTSVKAIGCNVVNIDADDLHKGKPHLVLGIVWQIIRAGLFNQINLEHVPGMIYLLREGETLDDLRKLSPEDLLFRWVNYHLAKAGCERRITNFTSDIIDSTIYTHLLHQIAPKGAGVNLGPLSKSSNMDRAKAMLREADKIGCKAFVDAVDVVEANQKLNMAFIANLFNKYPGLPDPSETEVLDEVVIEETREEKMYRNWMNSLGVDPVVFYLYIDLRNGLIIFQLYDFIQPGIVQWNKVIKNFNKMSSFLAEIQNCNYAIDVGKMLKFSLVGIQGSDIRDGNKTLTLALVWQLMRAYTLAVLKRCSGKDTYATDSEIIAWVNGKLQAAGKSTVLKHFNDPSISNGLVVIDLIDAIKPGIINYELVTNGRSEEDKIANAKYAITSGRKLGAVIYALPEDIVEVKSKMVMTIFACLMAQNYQNATENGN